MIASKPSRTLAQYSRRLLAPGNKAGHADDGYRGLGGSPIYFPIAQVSSSSSSPGPRGRTSTHVAGKSTP